MIPGQESHSQFLRRVRQILTARDVGIRFVDQVGIEVSLRWSASSDPVDVLTELSDPPQAVHVRRAVNQTTLATEYGCRVVAEWRAGSLRVTAIDVSDASAVYDIVLGLER